MKFLAFLLILSSAVTALAEPTARFVLTTTNHVALRTDVNDSSADKVIKALMTQKPTNGKLYIYIDSPGGSVVSGLRIIEAIQTSPHPVVCIASFAASMAFAILQSCDERIVLNSSILMQHEASYGVSGPAPHNLSMVNFLHAMLKVSDTAQAARIGITYEEFRARVRNDWWIFGPNNLLANTADSLGQVTCSKKLVDATETVSVRSLFGSSELTMSACPLLYSPVTVDSNEIRQINTTFTSTL